MCLNPVRVGMNTEYTVMVGMNMNMKTVKKQKVLSVGKEIFRLDRIIGKEPLRIYFQNNYT